MKTIGALEVNKSQLARFVETTLLGGTTESNYSIIHILSNMQILKNTKFNSL